jgi:hypothetical protein
MANANATLVMAMMSARMPQTSRMLASRDPAHGGLSRGDGRLASRTRRRGRSDHRRQGTSRVTGLAGPGTDGVDPAGILPSPDPDYVLLKVVAIIFIFAPSSPGPYSSKQLGRRARPARGRVRSHWSLLDRIVPAAGEGARLRRGVAGALAHHDAGAVGPRGPRTGWTRCRSPSSHEPQRACPSSRP